MDIVQTVHRVHGKCPLCPWLKSRESTESMDFLQTGILYHKTTIVSEKSIVLTLSHTKVW